MLMIVLSLSVLAAAKEHDYPTTPLLPNSLESDWSVREIEVDIDVFSFVYVAEFSTEPMFFDLDSPSSDGRSL